MARFEYMCKNSSCRSKDFDRLPNGQLKCCFCGRVYDEEELKASEQTSLANRLSIRQRVQKAWEDALGNDDLNTQIAEFEKVIQDLQSQHSLDETQIDLLHQAVDAINGAEAKKDIENKDVKSPLTIQETLDRADNNVIKTFKYPAIGIRNLIEAQLISKAQQFGFYYGDWTEEKTDPKTGKVTTTHKPRDYFILDQDGSHISLSRTKQFAFALHSIYPDLEFAPAGYPFFLKGDREAHRAASYLECIHALAHNTDDLAHADGDSQLDEIAEKAKQMGLTLKEFVQHVWDWFTEHGLTAEEYSSESYVNRVTETSPLKVRATGLRIEGPARKTVAIASAIDSANESDMDSFCDPCIEIWEQVHRCFKRHASPCGFEFGSWDKTKKDAKTGKLKTISHKGFFEKDPIRGSVELRPLELFRRCLYFDNNPQGFNLDSMSKSLIPSLEGKAAEATRYLEDIRLLARGNFDGDKTAAKSLSDLKTRLVSGATSIKDYVKSIWDWFNGEKLLAKED
jgi:hypothetical protein